MSRNISAEFENIDMAERAAFAIRAKVDGISRINIKTDLEKNMKAAETFYPNEKYAYDNINGYVGYSIYTPYGFTGQQPRYEPAARASAMMMVTAEENSVKTIVRMIRSLGALNIKDGL